MTTDPNVLHDWLTVGPASRLDGTCAERPYIARLLGGEARVWRGADGAPVATLDGRPAAACIRYDYLWLWPAGTPGALFAFPEFDAPDGRRIIDCDGIGVAVSGLRMVENFLDMGHFPFVHASYLGEVPHTEVKPYTVTIDVASDEILATGCRFLQPKASSTATGALEIHYRYRVMQPFTAMLHKTAFTRPGRMDAIALFVQPVDEEHIIAYTLMAYDDDTSSDTDLVAFQHTIFAQDKPILENQVPKRLPLRPGRETPVRCDALSIAYRKWLLARGMRYGALTD
ncbi:phenylpropionate dioxygenase-like ring-hydroxylating dioxygenase large terminal subunit [Pseudoduganella lurida]|uniref:Phenylpropionate dioxygenase-like ring-hydroxylating dioxygenase large terminal subunit n=1 Tax=Pseudoduganella lurida TaxID=1036180 RepID=A0A562R2P7_9BURK|nr:aromatic ring-hydroxylating dioxygenase subunit alpha [Pseudoduganella lurida]TWI62656.1 phenylpropionate dioxygenase-like ring-hydroxylating dioxygenase large terminal subunit [Pseudoduganella lurida]